MSNRHQSKKADALAEVRDPWQQAADFRKLLFEDVPLPKHISHLGTNPVNADHYEPSAQPPKANESSYRPYESHVSTQQQPATAEAGQAPQAAETPETRERLIRAYSGMDKEGREAQRAGYKAQRDQLQEANDIYAQSHEILKQQRDHLLAALKAALPLIDDALQDAQGKPGYEIPTESFRLQATAARAAIAAAEGEVQ
jgi:hypothetical protein